MPGSEILNQYCSILDPCRIWYVSTGFPQQNFKTILNCATTKCILVKIS